MYSASSGISHLVKHFAISLLYSSTLTSHALIIAHMSFLSVATAFASSLDAFICVLSMNATSAGVYGGIQGLLISFAYPVK